ncbi:hypothetical protein CR513_07012, partial [Mucuna pruriens]
MLAIEESKNLGTMKIEELQGSLEAYELRLNERNIDKLVDQSSQAQVTKKGVGDKIKWKKGKEKFTKGHWSSNQERGKPDGQRRECSNKKGGGPRNKRKLNRGSDDEAHVTQEDLDSNPVLLMATTSEECLNHMAIHKEWLTDLDTSRRSKI